MPNDVLFLGLFEMNIELSYYKLTQTSELLHMSSNQDRFCRQGAWMQKKHCDFKKKIGSGRKPKFNYQSLHGAQAHQAM